MDTIAFRDSAPNLQVRDRVAENYPQPILVNYGEDNHDISVLPADTPHRFYQANEGTFGATTALVNDINQCLGYGYGVFCRGLKTEYGSKHLNDFAGIVRATTNPAEFADVVSQAHGIMQERYAAGDNEDNDTHPVVLAIDNINLLRRGVHNVGIDSDWDGLADHLYTTLFLEKAKPSVSTLSSLGGYTC